MHSQIFFNIELERERDRETGRQTDRLTERERERVVKRERVSASETKRDICIVFRHLKNGSRNYINLCQTYYCHNVQKHPVIVVEKLNTISTPHSHISTIVAVVLIPFMNYTIDLYHNSWFGFKSLQFRSFFPQRFQKLVTKGESI